MRVLHNREQVTRSILGAAIAGSVYPGWKGIVVALALMVALDYWMPDQP